jgi:methylated-DNA-[protein]-cysteine S-methyltransferase
LAASGTEFQRSVWTALLDIPLGATRAYGQVAQQVADKSKTRAVAAAIGRNPIGIVVPCHRVVGADGSLTGYAGGLDRKRWLLDHEARVSGSALL